MTQGVPSLRQLAAAASTPRPLTRELPLELVNYMINIVDLKTVTTEPAQLQSSLAALWNEILTTEEDEFNADLREHIRQRAEELVRRADSVLGLMSSALDAAVLEPDDGWREYLTSQCTTAIDVLNVVRNDANIIESNMRNYPDDSAYD